MSKTSDRTFYIYCHTAPNGKRYIGQTSKSPEKRWKGGRNYQSCKYFNRAIEKYGWDNIKHEILAVCHTKQMADLLEIHLIAFFDTMNPEHGYNLTKGGDGLLGYKASDETRALLSKIRKERGISYEQQRAMQDGLKKNGYQCMPLTRQEMFERGTNLSGKNHPCYDHRKKKKDSPDRDYKRSEEWRGNISSGLKNSNKIKAKQRPVIKVDGNDNVVARYESITEAANASGISKQAISQACRGITNTAKGFFWRYEDDDRNRKADELVKKRHSIETIGLPVIQKDLDGNQIAVFASTVDASRKTGFPRADITACCRGKRKTSRGFIWSYQEQPED